MEVLQFLSFMQISGWAGRTKVFFPTKIGLVGWMVDNFMFSGNFLIEFYLKPVAFGASAVQMFI